MNTKHRKTLLFTFIFKLNAKLVDCQKIFFSELFSEEIILRSPEKKKKNLFSFMRYYESQNIRNLIL